MAETDHTQTLHRYLRYARDSLLWKLDDLSEYDIRRPMTPTGTNLLGLVKHLGMIELGYLGLVFDRHFDEHVPWFGPTGLLRDLDPSTMEPDFDMWAAPEESRQDVIGLYRRAWEHADATVAELGPEAVGRVPWWPDERNPVTLHLILTHVVAETQRHLGHADIVREMLDGAVGSRRDNDNMPTHDRQWWKNHRDRLEDAARQAG